MKYLKIIIGSLFSAVSCVSDFSSQPLTLSTHDIDFGETQTEQIVQVFFDSPEISKFSASVASVESNWLLLNPKSGDIKSSLDLCVSIDRSLMPEGESSARVDVTVGDLTKSIYITAKHPAEVEITPEKLVFESGVEQQKLEIRSRIGNKSVELSADADWLTISEESVNVPRYDAERKEETTVSVIIKVDKENLGIGEYKANITIQTTDGSFKKVIPVTLIKDDKEDFQHTVDGVKFSLEKFELLDDKVIVDFAFENISEQDVSFFPRFDYAYDNFGNPGKVNLKEIVVEEYHSYSNSLSAPLSLTAGATGTGCFEIKGLSRDLSSIQYLEVKNNLSEPFIFRNLILPGKQVQPLPSLDSPDYDKDGLKIKFLNVTETGSEAILPFVLSSNHEIESISLNLDNMYFFDNNDIRYTATHCSFNSPAYSKKFSISLPKDVVVSGTVSFPKIETISSSIQKIECLVSANSENEQIVIDNLNINVREREEVIYNKIASVDYFDIYLLGCYESSDELILDYLVKNVKDAPRTLEYSMSKCYLIDDVGDLHRISTASFTNGTESSYYPSVSIPGKTASRGILRISNVDKKASGIQYCLLSCNVNGSVTENAELVFSSRIQIEGRSTYSPPSSNMLYNISRVPDKVRMELIDVKKESNSAIVSFRLTNESSGQQTIKWDLYNTDSYALDKQGERHYITSASIGYYSKNHSYFSLEIPGKVMVKGQFTIPDISGDTNELQSILLVYSGNRYEFTDIKW